LCQNFSVKESFRGAAYQYTTTGSLVKRDTKAACMDLKILLVAEDMGVARYLESVIRQFGQVDIYSDSNESLEAFEQALSDAEPYDLVAMDLFMSKLDGAAAVKKMRQIEVQSKVPPIYCARILMISVVHDSLEAMENLVEGCNGYLFRPFTPADLVTQIRNVVVLD
jgi:CheY-like chemotaxis protein